MKIELSEKFLKDLKKLKQTTVYSSLKEFCLKELPKCDNFSDLGDVKKIRGYSDYYRIKFGDCRIGIKNEKDKIVLMRVLHRKDIYRFFP